MARVMGATMSVRERLSRDDATKLCKARKIDMPGCSDLRRRQNYGTTEAFRAIPPLLHPIFVQLFRVMSTRPLGICGIAVAICAPWSGD